MIRQLCLLPLLLISGCAVAGLAAAKFGAEPAIPAEYVLPPVATVVFVESPRVPIGQIVSGMIADGVTAQLTRYNAAPMLPADRIQQVRMKNLRGFAKMSVQSIGREAGAEQVIVVELQQYAVETATGSDIMRARATALVKVVSAVNGETLWPVDLIRGYPVSAEVPETRQSDGASEATMRSDLNSVLSLEIGRLFRDYKVDEVVE